MSADTVDTLRKAPFFTALDDATLAEIAGMGRQMSFRVGDRIVSELEFGADVYVLLRGEAEVTVDTSDGARQLLCKLGPGNGVGEMSSLTGQLRSATVTALGDVEALRIDDAAFDRLRLRRPEISLALLRALSLRIAETDAAIDHLFTDPGDHAGVSAHAPVAVIAKGSRKGSVRRAFRDLVVNHERDLAFLALCGFVFALLAVRLAVYLSFRFDFAPRVVLRTAYMTGFALLGGSACSSLLVFRPGARRLIAAFYGVGLALIFNELGVTLAFDIFFKDIHTADPNVAFDVERLYRRTEPLRAILIGFIVLVQAAYLRPFYRRVAFVLKTRMRLLLARTKG